MIMPMLREMRAEIAARFDGVDARLEALERAQASFKQALSADTLMSRLLTGEFDERIESLERRVRALDGHS
jgi:polyhydroxyalkanoate synthesis regulator phasin